MTAFLRGKCVCCYVKQNDHDGILPVQSYSQYQWTVFSQKSMLGANRYNIFVAPETHIAFAMQNMVLLAVTDLTPLERNVFEKLGIYLLGEMQMRKVSHLICFVVHSTMMLLRAWHITNCVFGSLISDVTCNYVSADGGRDGLWWPALPGRWLSYTGCWLSLLVMYWLLCLGCCFYI